MATPNATYTVLLLSKEYAPQEFHCGTPMQRKEVVNKVEEVFSDNEFSKVSPFAYKLDYTADFMQAVVIRNNETNEYLSATGGFRENHGWSKKQPWTAA